MKIILFTVIFVLLLIPCLAQEANPLFVVIVNDKRGFIDRTGKIVIEPQFAGANSFVEGRAVVAVDKPQYKYGYVDETGKFAIEAKFDSASDFDDGIAIVGIGTFGMHGTGDHKFGSINKDGSWLIKPKYRKALGFSESLAAVMNDEGKWGFIDKSGKVIIPFKFESGSFFSDGLACVFVNDKYGFIDKAGKIVVEPQFTHAAGFSEGLASIKIGGVLFRPYGAILIKKNEFIGQYAFIDKSGKVVFQLPLNVQDVHGFSEGLAAFEVDGDWGFIDKTGKVIIKPQYGASPDFSNGLALVLFNNEKGSWGFINKTGKVILRSDFAMVQEFENGLAFVYDSLENDAKYGYIDITGKVIWKPTK